MRYELFANYVFVFTHSGISPLWKEESHRCRDNQRHGMYLASGKLCRALVPRWVSTTAFSACR